MLLAAGTFGRPGIVIISPLKATINPAPTDGFKSLIVTVNPSGLANNFGLSDYEYCDFAIQIGNLSHPLLVMAAIWFLACVVNSTLFAP